MVNADFEVKTGLHESINSETERGSILFLFKRD